MSAIDTFRRAMRRHEKRARRAGFDWIADNFRETRITQCETPGPFDWCAEDYRRGAAERGGDALRKVAFLYERAADAVMRYRQASGEARPAH